MAIGVYLDIYRRIGDALAQNLWQGMAVPLPIAWLLAVVVLFLPRLPQIVLPPPNLVVKLIERLLQRLREEVQHVRGQLYVRAVAVVQPPAGRLKEVNEQFKEQPVLHPPKPQRMVAEHKVKQEDEGHSQVQVAKAEVVETARDMLPTLLRQIARVVVSALLVLRVWLPFSCLVALMQIAKSRAVADGMGHPLHLVAWVGPLRKAVWSVQGCVAVVDEYFTCILDYFQQLEVSDGHRKQVQGHVGVLRQLQQEEKACVH